MFLLMKRAHNIKSDPAYEPVRAALEDALLSCGKTVSELARQLDMSRGVIYEIMSGGRRVDVVELRRIALVTGNDPVELFKRTLRPAVDVSEDEELLSAA